MAWTTPPTFTNGVTVTETPLNQIRDDLRYLKGMDGAVTFENAIELTENVGIATPSTGLARLYAKTNGRVYSIDDAGTEYVVSHRLISARVRRTTDQSINNGAVTAITFDVEREDDGGVWDAGAPTRLTVPIDGTYLITGHIRFAANATGQRVAYIRLNGATFLAIDTRPAITGGNPTDFSISTRYRLSATNYVELAVYQDSGGALNVSTASAYSPEFAIHRLGD